MKYLIIAILSVLIGVSITYAGSKLNMVWEFFPDQSYEATFTSTEQVKVYKFVDGDSTCYVAMTPNWGNGGMYQEYAKGLKINKAYSTSLSCVK